MKKDDVLAYADQYFVLEFFPFRGIWNLPYLHIGYARNQDISESYWEEDILLDCSNDKEVVALVDLLAEKVKAKFAASIDKGASQGCFRN